MNTENNDNSQVMTTQAADDASPGAMQRHAGEVAKVGRAISPAWQGVMNAMPGAGSFFDPHKRFRREQTEQMAAQELAVVKEQLRQMVLIEAARGGYLVGQAQGAMTRDLNARVRVEVEVIAKAQLDAIVNFAEHAAKIVDRLKKVPNLPAEYLQRKIDELYEQADALTEKNRALLGQQAEDLVQIVRNIIQRNLNA